MVRFTKQRNSNTSGRYLLISHAVVFVAGLIMSSLLGKDVRDMCFSKEIANDEKRDKSLANPPKPTLQGDENALERLPNHIDKPEVLKAHLQALNDAMTPGRGYQPTAERSNSMLPEAKGSFWWTNNCGTANVPEAFGVAALNMTYPKEYFSGPGHPSSAGFATEMYFKYIHRYGGMVHGRNITSLVEFGNGGGVYSKGFYDRHGNDFMTVEGSGAGCELTISRGVPKEQVVQHDLRHTLYLGRRFDVAICTEVVEHVEPPFASQIVLSLVLHADVIWFSFKQVGLQNGAWINHPNERPFEMWRNLFDFYGYNVAQFDGRLTRAVYHRGNFIAYKRGSDDLNDVTEKMLLDALDRDVLDYGNK